jgi:hypothetical protein
MAALLTTTAPAPGLRSRGERPDVHNAYFAITIDAAVDLLEAREYQGLSRADRLAKALSEQQGFLNGFFDPALKAALDLRIVVEQQAATPITVALVGRVWGGRPVRGRRQGGSAVRPAASLAAAPRDGYRRAGRGRHSRTAQAASRRSGGLSDDHPS